MNICLITPSYPPGYGGVATSVEMRLHGMKVSGLGGSVLTLEYDGVRGAEETAGFEVIRLHRMHGHNKWGPLDAVQAFLAVLRYARQADVIHVVSTTSFFSIGACMAAILMKKKWALEMSLLGTDDPISAGKRRIGWLHNWIFCHADAVVGVSSALVAAARKFGLPESRLFRIPYPVDASLFRPTQTPEERVHLRQELNLPVDRPILSYVGFFSPRKGTHLIIEALAEIQAGMQPPYLNLIGWAADPGSDYEDRLRDAVKKAHLGNDVQFTGRITDRDLLAKYLRASDLYILPSSREGFPVAPLEAMASGLCAILTDIPGITADIAQNGENAIVVHQTVEELRDALSLCIQNPDLRAKISINARHTILERYTSEKVALQYNDLYQQMLGASRSTF